MLDVADTLAIHQLLALYGHLIDERQWSRLDEVFTDDLVFDATDFGLGVTHSLDELREAWTGPKAARYARDRWGVRVGPPTGWQWLVGLGFTLQVPRPSHPGSVRLPLSGAPMLLHPRFFSGLSVLTTLNSRTITDSSSARK